MKTITALLALTLCGQAWADTLTIDTFDRSTTWSGAFISAGSDRGYLQIRFGSYAQSSSTIQGQPDLVPFGVFTILVDGERYQRCALIAMDFKTGKAMTMRARCAFLG
jgi:hypothetical protein